VTLLANVKYMQNLWEQFTLFSQLPPECLVKSVKTLQCTHAPFQQQSTVSIYG